MAVEVRGVRCALVFVINCVDVDGAVDVGIIVDVCCHMQFV